MIEFVLYVILAVGILETTVDVGTEAYDTVTTTVQEVLADEEPATEQQD
tara:strand:+ start:489 stop:635 length:147 start_codon:yes stop_codon:yes gene_type:complete